MFQQGDLPHSGGLVPPAAARRPIEPGRVEFFADVAYNGLLLYPVGRGVYHGAHLAVRDDEAFGLYYDYLTLLVLAGHDRGCRARGPSCGPRSRASCAALPRSATSAGARAALAGLLARRRQSDERLRLQRDRPRPPRHGLAVAAARDPPQGGPHLHARSSNTIDDDPGYLYGTSQPQQMHWMKQEHPALFERIKKAVAAGRIELQGSFWVETDTNMPGGESLVRQSLVGRRFLQRSSDSTPTTCGCAGCPTPSATAATCRRS